MLLDWAFEAPSLLFSSLALPSSLKPLFAARREAFSQEIITKDRKWTRFGKGEREEKLLINEHVRKRPVECCCCPLPVSGRMEIGLAHFQCITYFFGQTHAYTSTDWGESCADRKEVWSRRWSLFSISRTRNPSRSKYGSCHDLNFFFLKVLYSYSYHAWNVVQPI